MQKHQYFYFFVPTPVARSSIGSKAKLFSIQDATIAASYTQLIAPAVGLSSVWVEAFNEQKVSVVPGLSDDIIPITLFPIGHKNEEPQNENNQRISNIS